MYKTYQENLGRRTRGGQGSSSNSSRVVVVVLALACKAFALDFRALRRTEGFEMFQHCMCMKEKCFAAIRRHSCAK